MKSESVDLGDLDLLLKTILRQMRPVVLNAAQTALLTSQVGGNIDANSLADKGREKLQIAYSRTAVDNGLVTEPSIDSKTWQFDFALHYIRW